ncbi:MULTISPECIES: cell envelope integrity protein TolA [unclassified Photobacterium]|uniref:cell envelope integrity protein TolA n=1 Tax=unclassified Photobacterium TaxID=2628852 RepID=UPI001B8BCC01|nr:MULTISPECIES: cell envelope integrity protein TolA [unclassified Photobacterium]MDO6705669.1 cell envelope integrity protein TolA [Photobacterium sp. 1_MG-2023]QUJ68439.1 cell envelope integrity protein TolA [Photobacterium sp. GJ3]
MKKNNYTVAIVISLFFHAVLFVALIWGTDFTMSKPKPHGSTIQAVVVDPALVNQQARQIREQRDAAKRAEQDRLERLERQAAALEKQRQAEEERLRKLRSDKLEAEKAAREADAERERIAREKAKAAEEKRKADEDARLAREAANKAEAERQAKLKAKQEAEEAARQAELARQKKVEEQKRAEEAARKAEADRQAKIAAKKKAEEEARKAEAARKEAERKAKEAQELQRQQEAALNDMFAGLEAESELRGSAKGQFVTDEATRYGEIYKQMIQQNLLFDQNFSGKECNLQMRLSANGLLLDVSDVGGDTSLCRAAKAAVVKVSQFPMPEDPAVVEKLRSIRLTVKPVS